MPGAQFVVYECAGHALILERPEGGDRILAFLAESEGLDVNCLHSADDSRAPR
jgi:hypothetical protein